MAERGCTGWRCRNQTVLRLDAMSVKDSQFGLTGWFEEGLVRVDLVSGMQLQQALGGRAHRCAAIELVVTWK